MTTATTAVSRQREPELLGQTVVVIGGSAGIGLETARRARTEGASVILTGRNPERLKNASNKQRSNSTRRAPRPSTPTIRPPCSRSSRISQPRLTTSWSPPALPTTGLPSRCRQRRRDAA
jgi:hypothetical protein